MTRPTDPEGEPHLEPVTVVGPGAYETWRASSLGRVTDALEEACLLDLIGPVDGRRVLDLGCGDGALASALAERGALVVGLDANRSALEVAAGRSGPGLGRRPSFIEGRIEHLPLRDGAFDIVLAVTVLCLTTARRAAVGEAGRVLRPGGRLVIGELGRHSLWAAKRRVEAWLGSRTWRAARFTTAAELCALVEGAGLTVETVRGSVFYPPLAALARSMAPLDVWLGSRTTIGAAFIAVAASREGRCSK